MKISKGFLGGIALLIIPFILENCSKNPLENELPSERAARLIQGEWYYRVVRHGLLYEQISLRFTGDGGIVWKRTSECYLPPVNEQAKGEYTFERSNLLSVEITETNTEYFEENKQYSWDILSISEDKLKLRLNGINAHITQYLFAK